MRRVPSTILSAESCGVTVQLHSGDDQSAPLRANTV